MKKILDKLSPYIIYFMLYAMIGWIYEVFLEVVVYKWGFSNRGVLFGPWLPVYGFGSLLFILLVYPIIKGKTFKKKLLLIPIVFILCMLSATLLELLTSYLCEFFMGSWPWQTYADYKYNFQARIALSPSIRFGIGGVVFLYLLQPLFEKIVTLLNDKRNKISIIIITILIVDFICTIISKLI
ncbi:MAG: putative ABC transporter permease [Bacilli bacterium]|nr:putative ABC transporter permease [Bacilli bacterium]